MIEISGAAESEPVTSEAVSAEQSIPRTFLPTILADLRRAGLVTSRRGHAGGWLLARPAAAVSIADIIRAVDGPLASVGGESPEVHGYDGSATPLQQVWVALRASVREVLETVTVEALRHGELPDAVTRRARSTDAWLRR